MIKKYCIILSILFLLIAGNAFTQENNILPINPVPSVEYSEESVNIGTDMEFSDTGTIDRIGADEIVIDDRLIKIDPDVNFFSATGEYILKSDLKTGNVAGYLLNSKNEIKYLWKIKEE